MPGWNLLLSVLSQAPAPQQWLTPGVLLTALGLLASAIVAVVSRSVILDRRIEKRATVDALEVLKASIADISKALSAAQTRDACVICRREVDARLSALHDEIREKPTRSSVNQAFEAVRALEDRVVAGEKSTLKLEGKVDAALQALVDLKAMVTSLGSKVDRLASRRMSEEDGG